MKYQKRSLPMIGGERSDCRPKIRNLTNCEPLVYTLTALLSFFDSKEVFLFIFASRLFAIK